MVERFIQNQGEYAVYGTEVVATGQTSTKLKFQVNAGQAWRVQTIDLEAPQNCTIELKYKEETTANELVLGQFYASDFPLSFKPTSTDNHLVIWEERTLSFQATNTYAGDITCRAIVQYIKVYLQHRGGT